MALVATAKMETYVMQANEIRSVAKFNNNKNRKNMAFEKHRGVVTTPPLGSSRVNIIGSRIDEQ